VNKIEAGASILPAFFAEGRAFAFHVGSNPSVHTSAPVTGAQLRRSDSA